MVGMMKRFTMAVYNGHPEIFKVLLKHGATITPQIRSNCRTKRKSRNYRLIEMKTEICDLIRS